MFYFIGTLFHDSYYSRRALLVRKLRDERARERLPRLDQTRVEHLQTWPIHNHVFRQPGLGWPCVQEQTMQLRRLRFGRLLGDEREELQRDLCALH